MIKSNKKIKAILLSAGFGKRLRPLTLNTPKCLVSINGEPLLFNWLRKLEKIGCEEVLINTHYLCEKVEEALNSWDQSKLKIKTIYEKKLLGTAGTLRENINFFKNCKCLLIHTDNFTLMNMEEFLDSFNSIKKDCLLSMVTFSSNNPEECGIVETDENGILINYHEKISNPPSNLANGAIFLFDENFLKFFSTLPSDCNDFCADIIPRLKGRIQTYFTNCLFIDIGKASSLELARNLVKNE